MITYEEVNLKYQPNLKYSQCNQYFRQSKPVGKFLRNIHEEIFCSVLTSAFGGLEARQ